MPITYRLVDKRWWFCKAVCYESLVMIEKISASWRAQTQDPYISKPVLKLPSYLGSLQTQEVRLDKGFSDCLTLSIVIVLLVLLPNPAGWLWALSLVPGVLRWRVGYRRTFTALLFTVRRQPEKDKKKGLIIWHVPAGTWRCNDFVLTLMRHSDVTSMSVRRHVPYFCFKRWVFLQKLSQKSKTIQQDRFRF